MDGQDIYRSASSTWLWCAMVITGFRATQAYQVSSLDDGTTRRRRHTRLGIDGQVVFEDGTVDSGIDHCILATGYQISSSFLSKPFIRKEMPPLVHIPRICIPPGFSRSTRSSGHSHSVRTSSNEIGDNPVRILKEWEFMRIE